MLEGVAAMASCRSEAVAKEHLTTTLAGLSCATQVRKPVVPAAMMRCSNVYLLLPQISLVPG